jgi:hypothetical protein
VCVTVQLLAVCVCYSTAVRCMYVTAFLFVSTYNNILVTSNALTLNVIDINRFNINSCLNGHMPHQLLHMASAVCTLCSNSNCEHYPMYSYKPFRMENINPTIPGFVTLCILITFHNGSSVVHSGDWCTVNVLCTICEMSPSMEIHCA